MTTETEAAIELIRSHPLTRQLETEKAAQTLKEREDAAAMLADARRQAADVLPPLQDRINKIEDEIKAHDLARNAILDRLNDAKRKKINESEKYDRLARKAVTTLDSSYDRQIDADLEFFRDRFEAIRHRSVNHDTRKGDRNLFLMTRKLIHRSNFPAIQKAADYCRAAIDRLEGMKLMPSYPADEVEAMKRGIPGTDEMTEATGEKPIYNESDANPRWALPSDDQFGWQKSKLLEKCRKMGI